MRKEIQPPPAPNRSLSEAFTIVTLIKEESVAGARSPHGIPTRVDAKIEPPFSHDEAHRIEVGMRRTQCLHPPLQPPHTIDLIPCLPPKMEEFQHAPGVSLRRNRQLLRECRQRSFPEAKRRPTRDQNPEK